MPSRGCSKWSRAGSAASRSSRSPRPRAARSTTTATTRSTCKARAAEINALHPEAKYPPIILLAEHHEPDAVYEHHRAANLCFVCSLHDGMNLVAKEFVAARDDEQGVLILSQFAGASRELARGARRQSLRCRSMCGGAPPGADDARRRAARPDALHARRRPRVQRLPVGRKNVARRRGDAPARSIPADGRVLGPQWLTDAARNAKAASPEARRARRVAAGRPPSAPAARCSSTSTARCSISRRHPTACSVDPDVTAAVAASSPHGWAAPWR